MSNVFVTYSNVVTPLGTGSRFVFERMLSKIPGIEQDEKGFFISTFSKADQRNLFGNNFSEEFPASSNMLLFLLDELQKNNPVDLADPQTLLIICSTKGDIDSFPVITELPLQSLAFSIRLKYKLGNEPVIISNACISGLNGIIHASRLLVDDYYSRIIVLGVDSVSDFVKKGFESLSALSMDRCAPFDASRKGLNLGEGAAIMVLEKTPADKFSVKVSGGALSNDANHITGPSRDGSGLYKAIKKVIDDTNVSLKEDNAFISPHGTGTVYNDEMESLAFTTAALTDVPMIGMKGYFGHTLGPSGMLEAIMGLEVLHTGQLPVTLGYREHGVTGAVKFIKENEAIGKLESPGYFLKTGSGFGGCNAAVLFEK